MILKEFGKTGWKVSEIGMGTYYDKPWIRVAKHGWPMGGRTKVKALNAGLDRGIDFVDTAEAYHTEPLVAKAMRGRAREGVFIATKVWLDNLRRDDLVRALERSLRLLQTPYVDLYQIHFPNPKIPIRETMGAMEEMVGLGKVRAIGVSNFSLEQMVEANSALSKHEIAACQVNYSLIHRKVENDIIPYCQRNRIALIAYYPLGHGLLAQSAKLAEVAGRNKRTPAQVALNWLVSRELVFAIPRASRPDHVIEDAGASDWRLGPGDIQLLEKEFPVEPTAAH